MNNDLPFNNTRSKKRSAPIDFSEYEYDKNGNISGLIDENEDDQDKYIGLTKLLLNYKKFKLTNEADDIEGDYIDDESIDDNSIDSKYTEDEKRYLESLDEEGKKKFIELEEKLNENDEVIPIRFRILKSDLDNKTKKNIIEKIDKYYCMEPDDNEYHKLYDWVDHIQNIPFGKYSKGLQKENFKESLIYCKDCLDKAVFGHRDAKLEIIKCLGKYLKNPEGNGNVIGLQGPMGNGKTTLIKKGLSQSLGKPFYFICLGGNQDSNYFLGHSYTYEGAQPGIIINALQKTSVMDPIIYFDELDKVSDTPKGEEIYNLLCHLTDSSQNTEFQDKYFANINIDLSKAMFVFSFNDKSKINPILLDRLTIIETQGFKNKDKIRIAQEYLIPEICNEIAFEHDKINIKDEDINYIIDNYTSEEGVRSLKKILQNIIGNINLCNMLGTSTLDGLINIKSKDLGEYIDRNLIDKILKKKKNSSILHNLYI